MIINYNRTWRRLSPPTGPCPLRADFAPTHKTMATHVMLGLMLAVAVVVPSARALDNGLGDLPPMGWNSWNLAGCKINETFFRATVDALAAQGFREASGAALPSPSHAPTGAYECRRGFGHGAQGAGQAQNARAQETPCVGGPCPTRHTTCVAPWP